mmetsp:Transcript_17624/g.61637  ORF Transcript_17624/g.61637 Transcript_17624/m.61637 type:complete len:258 (-) Transcript_17624:8-781(-)
MSGPGPIREPPLARSSPTWSCGGRGGPALGQRRRGPEHLGRRREDALARPLRLGRPRGQCLRRGQDHGRIAPDARRPEEPRPPGRDAIGGGRAVGPQRLRSGLPLRAPGARAGRGHVVRGLEARDGRPLRGIVPRLGDARRAASESACQAARGGRPSCRLRGRAAVAEPATNRGGRAGEGWGGDEALGGVAGGRAQEGHEEASVGVAPGQECGTAFIGDECLPVLAGAEGSIDPAVSCASSLHLRRSSGFRPRRPFP